MWKLLPAFVALTLAGGCSGDDDSNDGAAGGMGGTGAVAGSSNAGAGGGAGSPVGGSAGSSGSSSAGSGSGGKGGTGGASAGTGGKAGNAGSAGTSGGGPVLRAAVSLNVLAGSSCSLPAEFIDVPEVSAGHPVTATAKADALQNGGMTADGNRVTIACMWAQVGDALLFDGAIRIRIGASTTLVNLGAMALTDGQPAQGGLFVSGPILPQQYNSPANGCTHTPIEIDPVTRSIWGEIKCPVFESFDGEDTCEIGTSYYFFENCPES